MSSMVLFLCPNLDRPVVTGIMADLVGLTRLVRRGTGFRCGACGVSHILSLEDTWLSLTHPLPVSLGLYRGGHSRQRAVRRRS
ncbi:MAG: hypothetical protein AB7O44_27915 [Hyphomicrobiaceae bacterium]